VGGGVCAGLDEHRVAFVRAPGPGRGIRRGLPEALVTSGRDRRSRRSSRRAAGPRVASRPSAAAGSCPPSRLSEIQEISRSRRAPPPRSRGRSRERAPSLLNFRRRGAVRRGSRRSRRRRTCREPPSGRGCPARRASLAGGGSRPWAAARRGRRGGRRARLRGSTCRHPVRPRCRRPCARGWSGRGRGRPGRPRRPIASRSQLALRDGVVDGEPRPVAIADLARVEEVAREEALGVRGRWR
jgi:hypothetical protein